MQQRATNSAEFSAIPPIVHEVLHSSGQPLDAGTRAFMEPHFGHNFSNLRVHADAKAAESAHAVNALAYTVGRNVVFGSGQYAPGTHVGQKLLAHELTHVVQQRGAAYSNVQKKLAIGEIDDAYELEAEAHAANVVEKHSDNTMQVKERPGLASLQRKVDSAKVDPVKVLSDAHQECAVATARTDAPPSAKLSFRLGSSDLSSSTERATKLESEDEKKIADFVTDVRSRHLPENIRIDGYASTDGDESRNWILSCERATEAKKEFMTKHGIPAAKIKTFAHGPTSEFSKGQNLSDLVKNRTAILSTIPAPSPMPTPVPPPGPDPAPPPSNSFQDCTSDQIPKVKAAIATARADLDTAISKLSTRPLTSNIQDALWLAFRVQNNVPTADSVKNKLVAIKNGLPTLAVTCEQPGSFTCRLVEILHGGGGKALGFTKFLDQQLHSGPIHLCISGWLSLEPIDQALTVLHEASHRFNNTGDGGGYFEPECEESSETENSGPFTRLDNADCYSCFVFYLTHVSEGSLATRTANLRKGASLHLVQVPKGIIDLNSPNVKSPKFEAGNNLPQGNTFQFRWLLMDNNGARYLMRALPSDEIPIDFSPFVTTYIPAKTRELLRSRSVTIANVLCRVLLPEGNKLLTLPVQFSL
ncbi:MAG: hypothetical protein NVS4B12_18100 [Ktedonobacteraceae bacterium]